MSTSRVITRLAAAAAVGFVLATVGFAAPAFAANSVDVDLNSVSSNFTVGSRADTFNVTLRNITNDTFNIKIVFGVKLTGLTADKVRIVRAPNAELSRSESNGQVVFTDPLGASFLPRRSQNINYSIQFLAGAPSGRSTLTFQALRDNSPTGSASRDINVKGGTTGSSPTPKNSTIPPTDPGQTGAGGSQVPGPAITLGPRNGAPQLTDSGGVPVGLYIIGALLVGIGGAILWLLLRQRAQPVEVGYPTADYDVVPPTLGYPAARHAVPGNLHPTTPMTALRAETVVSPAVVNTTVMPSPVDNAQAPPPVDPWASQAGYPEETLRAVGDPPAPTE